VDSSSVSGGRPAAASHAPSTLSNDEAFACLDVEEVRVRFSPPGFVEGSHVGLFVLYEGLPPGQKRLRIWWDEENEPTLFETLALGEGERRGDDPETFRIERVIEHRYQDVSAEEIRRVRAELKIDDRPDNCSTILRTRVATARWVRHSMTRATRSEPAPPVTGSTSCPE
jgi:hypothetical protein